ncbi:MAG TPA: PspC domain-containing protein [Allosphingosinicella sp.]|jgi:phage shock protein PspC (stress-responsive transcriptional regulator)
MQDRPTNLFWSNETLFGVCEALGEDFGFKAIYLRALFALFLFWNPLAVIGAYLALGVVVLFSRLLAPHPRAKAAAAGPEAVPAPAEAEARPLPLAA